MRISPWTWVIRGAQDEPQKREPWEARLPVAGAGRERATVLVCYMLVSVVGFKVSYLILAAAL